MPEGIPPKIILRRNGEWYGSGLPLKVFINNTEVGVIPDRYGILQIELDNDEEQSIFVRMEHCKSQARRIKPAYGRVIKLVYVIPQMPFFSALLDAKSFGILQEDR